MGGSDLYYGKGPSGNGAAVHRGVSSGHPFFHGALFCMVGYSRLRSLPPPNNHPISMPTKVVVCAFLAGTCLGKDACYEVCELCVGVSPSCVPHQSRARSSVTTVV